MTEFIFKLYIILGIAVILWIAAAIGKESLKIKHLITAIIFLPVTGTLGIIILLIFLCIMLIIKIYDSKQIRKV